MLSFLDCGGEQCRRIRDHDWAATPLGAVEEWPPALKTLVGVMLGAAQPMFVAWGRARTLLYNDGYAAVLADRHPAALGRPFFAVWPEIEADLTPLFDRVFAGESVHMDDIALQLDRPDRPREAHFAFSYTPVRGEGGAVAGLFCPCTETTEQVVARRALREERDRYDAVLNGMGEGFIILDRDFRVVQMNAEGLRIDGRPAEEIIGRHLLQVWPEAEELPSWPLYRDAMATKEPRSLEYRHRSDVHDVWLDVRAYPVGDRLAVFYRDVTDRKRAEEALRDGEARLRAILDTVPVGLVLAEAPSGRLTGGNAQAERIFGHPVLPSPDIESYRDWVSRHPDGRLVEPGEYPMSRVLREGAERAELEVIYHRGDGRDAWVRLVAAPIRDGEGRMTGGVVASLDIDREKRAEAELRRWNDTLESQVAERTAERDRMWRLSTDLMLVAGFDAVIAAVNPAWTVLFGWAEEELVGRSFLDLVHPDDLDTTRQAAADLSGGVTISRFENRYRARDGSYRVLSWAAVPGAGLIHAVGRDVTAERAGADELAAAQEQLRQAQKMEAVGQLTGGIAHDFNNLLTVIRGSVDLLRRPDLDPDRRARYVDAIGDTADRAARLTGQLLAFARRQALKPEAFDVRDRLRTVAEMLDSVTGAPVRIELSLPDAPCVVHADPGQFETALVNMAVNARDAMGGEGVLTIAVACRRSMPAIRGHGGGPGPFVAVALSDTGGGIAPDALPHLFEPFFTTKEVGRGTGLGLSQVFGFAKQSGGDVAVDSEPGRGATFTLYLPQVDAAPAAAAPAPVAGSPSESLRILVVEDNLEVGRFAMEALADCGHQTHWVASAEEALDRLGAHGDGYDVMFSDVVMPGMGGLELARRVAERLPALPVVLASGYSHVLAQEGAYGFELLAKPYSAADLSLALARAVGAGGIGPSTRATAP